MKLTEMLKKAGAPVTNFKFQEHQTGVGICPKRLPACSHGEFEPPQRMNPLKAVCAPSAARESRRDAKCNFRDLESVEAESRKCDAAKLRDNETALLRR